MRKMHRGDAAKTDSESWMLGSCASPRAHVFLWLLYKILSQMNRLLEFGFGKTINHLSLIKI